MNILYQRDGYKETKKYLEDVLSEISSISDNQSITILCDTLRNIIPRMIELHHKENSSKV